MKTMLYFNFMLIVSVVLISVISSYGLALAHCDTLSGPVVETAKNALKKGDVTPVLKWVKKENEKEIKEMFKKVLDVGKLNPEAKNLAEMYFFETLVRIHRAGEGAPYTGLKPAGEVEPSVAEADKALEKGSVDNLVKMVTESVAKGIRERYEHTAKTKKDADKNLEAGREFVKAYVEFTHYVERIHSDATAQSAHHGSEKEPKDTKEHQH